MDESYNNCAELQKPHKKENIWHNSIYVSIMSESRLVTTDLGVGVGRINIKGNEEMFGGDEYAHSVDGDDRLMRVYIYFEMYKVVHLSICGLLYVN